MSNGNRSKSRGMMLATLTVVALLAGAALAALLVNITERKEEARQPWMRVVELTDDTEDPEIWGKNFPVQYDLYKRTVDMTRTKFGGSEAMPRDPSEQDPRSVVSQQKVEEDPRLSRMWAGYAFAVDFREERGHAYMLEDQTLTQRQVVAKQPGTCLNCHASTYVTYKKLGDGDIMKGFEKMNQLPYAEARALVEHPVACIDCHDPATMTLRITRPAFIEGIRALKGDANFDPNTMATRQEMRAWVCGQCHVEYYFKGPEKRLVYPWAKGLGVDGALELYDASGFKDWTHALTGAPMLKAQHPEFETWSQGIHASAGVACADCHMPYMRVGGTKVSDHHVRSPLLNINRACQGCHGGSETELLERAERIQSRHFEMRNAAMDALMALIDDLEAARAGGRPDSELAAARYLQRRATFILDYSEAENSTGFHADQAGARMLSQAVDFARQGQLAVRDPGFRPSVEIPAAFTAAAAPAP